ncbi:MAG: signal recognition particle receptor subunit alpha, partial [Pseudomonadota bacterium]
MFSFFKKKSPPPAPVQATPEAPAPAVAVATAPAPAGSLIGSALAAPIDVTAIAIAPERERWLAKLTSGLRKTGSSISGVFTGTQIDDALYEDLETALLMADTGVKA